MTLTGGNVSYVPTELGYYIQIRPTAPAAGNPLVYTYTGPEAYRLQSIYFGISSSAVVANRYAYVIVQADGGAPVWFHKSSLAQVASSSNARPWNISNRNYNSAHWSTVQSGPCPDLWLLPGFIVTIGAENLQAADTVYSIALHGWKHKI